MIGTREKTFLDRLNDEYVKLRQDQKKLCEFMGDDKFHELSLGHKVLMSKQYGIMQEFLDVLNLRIELHSK